MSGFPHRTATPDGPVRSPGPAAPRPGRSPTAPAAATVAADDTAFQIAGDLGANAFDSTAEAVDQARRAALSSRLGAGAYGMLCQFIPALLHPVEDAACALFAEEASALHEFSDGLRHAQRSYHAADSDAATAYGRLM